MCSATPEMKESSMIESIPIQVTEKEPGVYLPYIDIVVDGQNMTFLLDTGAATSSIETNDHTSKYPSKGKTESKGASGKATPCDQIQPDKFAFGGQEVSKPMLKRCDRNVLGLDMLRNVVFQVDFLKKKLNVLKELPAGKASQSIRIISTGHVTIPLTLGGKTIDVLYDTGSDATVIDCQFIENNPKLFSLVRSEDGFDAHGNRIPSKIYKTPSLKVGDLNVNDVEMAAFDFGPFMRGKMEGAPIILGNNVITKGKWSFDLEKSQWTLEVY